MQATSKGRKASLAHHNSTQGVCLAFLRSLSVLDSRRVYICSKPTGVVQSLTGKCLVCELFRVGPALRDDVGHEARSLFDRSTPKATKTQGCGDSPTLHHITTQTS